MASPPSKTSINNSVDVKNEIPYKAIKVLKPSTYCTRKPAKRKHQKHSQATYCTRKPVKNKQVINKKSDLKTTQHQSGELNDVCRICLLADTNMLSMMSKIGSDSIADMFYSITAVKVAPEENYPLMVCSHCRNCLIDCYRFRIKCIESNTILQSKIGGKNNLIQNNSSIAGKTDKQTQSCVNVEINGKNEGTVKIEMDIDPDLYEKVDRTNTFEMDIEIHQNNEELGYLEEDISLTNESDKVVHCTPNKNLLKREKKKYTEKLHFSCLTCPRKFLELNILRVHSKTCSDNKQNEYKCGQCTQCFGSEYDLKIHSAIHIKGNKWKCTKCEKDFTDRTKFSRHIRRHMDTTKRWSCESCGKAFAEKSALVRHSRVHTGVAREKKYSCKLCNKKFGDRYQLNEHNANHTGVRPCSCDVCGKTFASSRLLASHSRVHSDDRPYECSYCIRRFREKSTRDTHHRTHTGERPYICSVCGKSFIQNSNLRLHMRTHTGEKPYTCQVCGRKFSSGSSLCSHKRIHTGEKPYSCAFCGKRFARMDIKGHLRLHTGERPHACCACPKQFVSAAALREHRLVHTGEKPFQCTLCPAKFKKKMYLTNHLKRHAKDKKVKKKHVAAQENINIVVEGNEFIVRIENENINIQDQQTSSAVNENVICTKHMDEDTPTSECTGENRNVILNAYEEELILLDDSDVKTELVVVDDGQTIHYQNIDDVCSNEVIVGGELNVIEVNVIDDIESGINLTETSTKREM
ncbi:oocyte zinc finger protein XlCOF6-like [Pararge aegeria]|uniref:oocyte zinc finger protein XlCOF6-like n=1 Tax=Pararge aegeria TaxID=116150 RepID=UPI0019D29C9A|nr:oocyte zinc finger protein XlCOF6-like [Pararge aegeria]